jgi:glycosyltransferase involved in cell wall biosynthesis
MRFQPDGGKTVGVVNGHVRNGARLFPVLFVDPDDDHVVARYSANLSFRAFPCIRPARTPATRFCSASQYFYCAPNRAPLILPIISMARILITNFHPGGGGGHVSYIRSLVHGKSLQEHQIAVATPRTSRLYQQLQEDGFPSLHACDFPAKLLKEPGAIGRSLSAFRKIVRQFHPDIVHVNGVDIFQALWSFPVCRNYKIVRTHHAVRALPTDTYHRWLYQHTVAQNIFVSEAALRLSLSGQTPWANAVVIENGVDLDHFQPRPKDCQLARTLGIDPSDFCLGTCAGTGTYKRIDLLIEALRRLGPGRNVTVVALGEPTSGRLLEHKARQAGVPRFIYAGFHKDVRPFVSLFDVGFVLSDSIETLSYAAREMMALGKPLISSSFSGLRNNVRHGIDGWLVPPGQVDPLVRAVETCRAMTLAKLQEFSKAARASAESHFSVHLQQEKHARVYASLAS